MDSGFAIRLRRMRAWLAPFWALLGVIITVPAFIWHLEYVRAHGPQSAAFMPALFATAIVGPVLYAVARAHWRGAEFYLFLAVPLLVGLLSQPVPTVAALMFVLAAYGAGSRLPQPTGGVAERALVACAWGFSLWIVLLLLAGAVGLLYPVTVALIGLAGLLFGWRQILQIPSSLKRLARAWADDHELASLPAGILVAFLVAFTLIGAMVAFAPARAWDVLHHHLPPARYYAETHRLKPFPDLDYSYFPQGAELLMAGLWSVAATESDRGIAAQLAPCLFFPLSIVATWAICRRLGGTRGAALIAATATTSTPFLHWDGVNAKNDVMLAFFLLMGLLCFLMWLDERRWRWLVAGVIFSAIAMHVKYVAAFGAAALGVLYLYAVCRQSRPWLSTAALLMLFTAVASPYMLRAWAAKGNPFYPQSASVAREAAVQAHERGIPVVSRFAEVTGAVLFRGRAAFENIGPSDNPAGVYLVLFVPFTLLALVGLSPAVRACTIFAGLYFALWALQLSIVRYAIPFIPVIAALTALAIDRVLAKRGWAGGITLGGLVYSHVFALLGVMILNVNAPLLALHARRIDAGGYLSAVVEDFSALDYVRTHAAAGDRVLGIESCSIAYAPQPERFACTMCYGAPCRAAAIDELVRAHRPAWVVVRNRPEYRHLPDQDATLANAGLEYQDRAYRVFRLAAKP